MDFNIQVEPRGRYFYARLTGTFNLLEAQSHVQRAFEMCAQHDIWRIFMDVRGLQGSISAGERYEWASRAASAHQASLAAGHPPVRMALLSREESLDPVRLGQAVAQNRGLDLLVTLDPAEAAAWLGIKVADVLPA